MAQKILIKKSAVAAKAPTDAQLDVGELAVNTADALLYTKHSDGSIKRLSPTLAERTKIADSVSSSDARLTNSREWSEATITQAEAEGGIASTRRAWTAQRVRQAINAWWQLVTSGFGRNLVSASNEAAARTILQLGTPATHSYGAAANTIAQGNDSRIVNAVPNSRTITAGTGLTGGGTLAADRTLAVAYGTVAGTAAQGNDSRITGALQSSQVVQVTGTSTTGVMSQEATTDALATKAALRATSNIDGGVRMRLSGTTLYITNDGSNA